MAERVRVLSGNESEAEHKLTLSCHFYEVEINYSFIRYDHKFDISGANMSILERHPANPIFKPSDFEDCVAVFNPGQTWFEGKPLLLLPIAHNSGDKNKFGQDITAHVARTSNFIDFEIDENPLFKRTLNGHIGVVREQCIDFRITYIEEDENFYIVHPGCGDWGTMGILAKTKDWKTFENIDIISLPDNRIPCLFPRKVNGKYYRLDRPYRVAPNDHHDMGNIWLSSSPDLIHWGAFRPLLKSGCVSWGLTKIGPTPPVWTPEGWLLLIHGVAPNVSGGRYSIGAMLLDLMNPEKIIGLTQTALLYPEKEYEFHGMVPNVVFPAGFLVDWDKDELHLYYGAADSSVALAQGSVKEIVALCLEQI
jgi:beta-1,4-mannooligosaccharide/beta-1,4-mannosyl-N-acetylglucosamine phosphorylase